MFKPQPKADSQANQETADVEIRIQAQIPLREDPDKMASVMDKVMDEVQSAAMKAVIGVAGELGLRYQPDHEEETAEPAK